MTELLTKLQQELEMTNDWLEKMEIQEKIDGIELELGVQESRRPPDSPFECFNCSA